MANFFIDFHGKIQILGPRNSLLGLDFLKNFWMESIWFYRKIWMKIGDFLGFYGYFPFNWVIPLNSTNYHENSFWKGIFNKLAKYCHGTTDFISQIHENIILDTDLRDELETMTKEIIDSRMSIFLKKYGAFKKNFILKRKKKDIWEIFSPNTILIWVYYFLI